MRNQNIIISSSKDTFIKFWDLKTEHNFKTLLGHRSEVSINFLFIYLRNNNLIVLKFIGLWISIAKR